MAITRICRIAAFFCLPFGASLLLAACGGDVKEELGLTHRAPDEFQVYSRPALSVPPEFDLRPPGVGSPYVVGTPSDVEAHNQILGIDSSGALSTLPDPQQPDSGPNQHFLTAPASTAVAPVSSAPLPSNSDAQFLANIGAQKADPHVRQEILDDKFAGATPKNSSYLFNSGTDAPSTVDAQKEAERLKQDKAQNQSVTTGETPVVVPEDKGILGSLGSIF